MSELETLKDVHFNATENTQHAHHGKRMTRRIHLLPLAREAQQYDAAGSYASLLWFEDFSMSVPSVMSLPISIDKVTTQTDLYTINKASLSPKTDELNDFVVDRQATLIIPVVESLNTEALLNEQGSGMQGFAAHIRKLVRSSGIYALSSLASPLVTLIIAPFLTHNLARAEYGAFAVLTTAIALMAGISQLGLGSAFFRSYSYDYDSPRDRLGVISTTILLLSLISIPVAIAVIAVAPWLTIFLLNSPSFSLPLRLAALVVLLQNLTIPGFAWLRAENRAGFFSTLSIANLLITLSATIVLVGIMHRGIAGAIIAVGMGYGSIVACTLPLLLLRAGMRFRVDIARGLLTFGLPNVANFVSVWILQLSDRYLLSHLTSLSQTASYAVAYSLGGVLSAVIIAPFSLAWPSTMYAIAKKDNAADIFRLVFRWFSILLCVATFGLSLLSMIILNLFFPPSYHSAALIIPIITTSILFYGVYNVFTIGVSIRRKTWFAVIFTTIAALTNVGLNLILIPMYGPMGAALSTLLAYAVLALIAYSVNQRIYPVPFEIGRFIVALMIGIALYTGSIFLAQTQKIYIAWGIFIVAFALYSCCLIVLGRFKGISQKNWQATSQRAQSQSTIEFAATRNGIQRENHNN